MCFLLCPLSTSPWQPWSTVLNVKTYVRGCTLGNLALWHHRILKCLLNPTFQACQPCCLVLQFPNKNGRIIASMSRFWQRPKTDLDPVACWLPLDHPRATQNPADFPVQSSARVRRLGAILCDETRSGILVRTRMSRSSTVRWAGRGGAGRGETEMAGRGGGHLR